MLRPPPHHHHQVDHLDPGGLAEAYVLAAAVASGPGGVRDDELLAALRRNTLAKADSIRPQPLSVMVACLACLQVCVCRRPLRPSWSCTQPGSRTEGAT